ncbi:MAG: tetratricopeptide repeat protein [Anaerolineae bacterium]|nr:tetratricopeptide repeat protein [Anaerolineae bacterium]
MAELIANRYQLLEQLGVGGMGAVYRTADRLTGDFVALKKVIIPTLPGNTTPVSDSTDLRLALSREFRTLALLRHPNIVTVQDYGFDAERQPFFTMNLVNNPQTILEAGKQRTLPEKTRLLLEILEALSYLHRRGIIHRDLKPGNVLVDADGTVKVLDFGLAITGVSEESRQLVGTAAYMAPELLMEEPASVASDLYAFGIIAYQMLAGRHPFNTGNITLLINQILSAQVSFFGIDERFIPVVGRLLTKSPADRYQEAAEVSRALCDAAGLPLPPESIAVRESFLQASRFIGRDTELGQLRVALRRITQSAHHPAEEDDADTPTFGGGIWLIGGESGVGKSRLVDELRVLALIRGAHVLRGQGVADGGPFYQFWRDPLRRMILWTDIGDSDAAVLRDIVPDIAALLERSVPDAPKLDGIAFHQRLTAAIMTVFRAQTEPVVLLMEDLQWATESLLPLRVLAGMAAELPLLIIGTYRNDEKPDLPDSFPDAQVLILPRLSSSAIASLSESMLGEAGKQPEVVDLLERETEGNVFFIVEVVRALAEEAGRLGDIGQVTLPQHVFAGGIQRVVLRRLNRVPEADRPLLRLAAIAGRQLDLQVMDALATVLNRPADSLESWLTTCANAAVLDTQDGHWRFAHDKLREALLADLPLESRPALYRQVADALETFYRDDAGYAWQLTHLWAQAGDTLKEGHYAGIAADMAAKANNYQDAIRLFNRALALEAYFQAENPRQAEINLYLEMGRAHYNLSDYDPARTNTRQALERSQAQDDRFGIAEAISLLGQIDMRQGNMTQAADQINTSLAMYREIGKPLLIGYGLMNRANIESYQGATEKARDTLLECQQYMIQAADPVALGRTLNNLGITYDMLGDFEQASACFEQSLVIRRKINDRHGIAYTLYNLGAMLEDQGQWEQALELYSESLKLLRVIGDRQSIAAALSSLGSLTYRVRGDYQTARRYLRESLALSQAMGIHPGSVMALTRLGETATGQGEYTQAHEHFREALRLAREHGLDNHIKEIALYIGELRVRQGRIDSGLALIGLIQAQAGNPVLPRVASRILDRLHLDMTPDVLAVALERGAALDWEAVQPTLLDDDIS